MSYILSGYTEINYQLYVFQASCFNVNLYLESFLTSSDHIFSDIDLFNYIYVYRGLNTMYYIIS
jgi:hypothetical protein